MLGAQHGCGTWVHCRGMLSQGFLDGVRCRLQDMMAELKVGTYPDEGVTQLASCREKTLDAAVPDRTPVWW